MPEPKTDLNERTHPKRSRVPAYLSGKRTKTGILGKDHGPEMEEWRKRKRKEARTAKLIRQGAELFGYTCLFLLVIYVSWELGVYLKHEGISW